MMMQSLQLTAPPPKPHDAAPKISKPKYYSVHLPCKPYLRKYMGVKYGYPFQADNRTALGCFVNATLVKERFTDRSECYTDSFIHRHFTASFEVRVSNFTFTHIGFDFKMEKVIEINQMIEAIFEEHMHLWVDARYVSRYKSKTRIALIEQFAADHGIIIEQDITLDALKQSEYRLRREIERRKQMAAKNLPGLLFN